MRTDQPVTGAFSLRAEPEGDETMVVTLAGDVDLHNAPQLRDRLSSMIDEGITTIVVDLAEVTFIDSMTLGVLLGASKRLRPRGGQLRIVVPEPGIRKVFEITLLDRIFQLYHTREAALARVADEPARTADDAQAAQTARREEGGG